MCWRLILKIKGLSTKAPENGFFEFRFPGGSRIGHKGFLPKFVALTQRTHGAFVERFHEGSFIVSVAVESRVSKDALLKRVYSGQFLADLNRMMANHVTGRQVFKDVDLIKVEQFDETVAGLERLKRNWRANVKEAVTYGIRENGDLDSAMDLQLQEEQEIASNKRGSSKPCENCWLCGNDESNKKNMVKSADSIRSKANDSEFPIAGQLTCKNAGIYVAECKVCAEQFVGMAENFSGEWKGYKYRWGKMPQLALQRHVNRCHPPNIVDCYDVTFVDGGELRHVGDSLRKNEATWIRRLEPQINLIE